MHIVLLSGGAGKRLWPLSNGVRTKAFLKLLPAPGGGKESMLQRVIRQLERSGQLASSLIVTHHSQLDITFSQIGERIPVVSEPSRRGTFNAIALASSYLRERMRVAEDGIICVMPVDLFAEDDFYAVIKRLPAVLAQSQAKLALIGADPSHPSDQYGYIVPQPGGHTAYRVVERFAEKPDEREARRLIAQRALWNCGIFTFRLGFMLAALEQRKLPASYGEWLALFDTQPDASFDREVVERSTNAVVVPYGGPWHDLGSWETLTQQLADRVTGPGSLSDDTTDTHIVNELPVPVHVIGGQGLVVAASPDGILVTRKGSSSEIKKAVPDAASGQAGRYDEKQWGTRTVYDSKRETGQPVSRTSKVAMLPGMGTVCHEHAGTKEIVVVLAGRGEIEIDGARRPVEAGETVEIQPGLKHRVTAVTALEYIEVHVDVRPEELSSLYEM
ncbi:sugar phosphate nucleotidyltransferase [uncultured Paenibacillus sp.]|uniref:sugar phosphate nucleotidyltransferase n=1 Tax=uncultured Paenibacillus sp. TaxID=227322 RepID=UPI0028D003D8|nr:sugar phosphate nucleotidyltransferase [uncultured Paenibacillus sp.]